MKRPSDYLDDYAGVSKDARIAPTISAASSKPSDDLEAYANIPDAVETESTPKKKEKTFTDDAKHYAGLLPRIIGENVGSVIKTGMNAFPNVTNAVIGAYHDLSTPDERAAIDSGPKQIKFLPGDEAHKTISGLLSDAGVPKPEGKGERIASDILGALVDTRSLIGGGEAKAGKIADFLKSNPGTQYLATLLGTGASSGAREVGFGPGGQVAASLLASGAAVSPSMLRKTIPQMAENALSSTTKAQQEAAQALMFSAAARGTPITAAEALAQINGGSTLQPVQRVIEQSAAGGPRMEEFMRGRVEGNKKALKSSLDDIAVDPTISHSDVSDIPLKMQSTAEDVIKDAKNLRTSAVNPFYEKAAPDSLQKDQLTPIMEKLDKEIEKAGDTKTGAALKAYKKKLLTTVEVVGEDIKKPYMDEFGQQVTEPNPFSKKVKDIQTKIGPLETAYKETRNALEAPIVSPEAFLSSISGILSPINHELGQALSTNANIKEGRNLHAALSENIVNPLERGTIGEIANKSDLRSQARALLPENPMAYDEKSVRNTIGKLKEQDPNIAKSWTRQYLQDTFNEVSQNLQGGKNQYGAAKFASKIAGNEQQAKNLRSAIIASTGSEAAYDGFRKLIDIFEAQGKRLQVGSPTTNNAEIIAQLKGGAGDNILPTIIGGATGIATGAGQGLATAAGVKGINGLGNWWNNMKYGQNSAEMARVLTSDDGVMQLQKLAKQRKNSPAAIAIARSIINPLKSDQ